MKHLVKTLMLAVMALAAVSCGSTKKFVYLNDMTPGKQYQYNAAHEAVIQPNDRLSISVSCKQPELALPFNIQNGSFKLSSDGASASTSAEGSSYKVNVDGDIEFPILGTVKLSGLTLREAEERIKQQIIDGNYIKSPLVSIDFLNFKYTVWGAVAHNGTFSAEDGRITLIEALANAGDVTDRAQLDRVAVIRDVDGNKMVYFHDLRNSSMLQSPCFFLQQNDVIYVEPRYRKKDKEDRTLQFATLFMTAITTVCSVIWAINSVKK